jgi:peptidoglycan hydrolase-like protein with peptidoglycan-binding domain
MNITANNVASKLFVAFVATAMLFMLVTPAKAATTASATELQAQIDALMAQIAALQGKTTPAATSVACTFTRAITVGAQGEDVKCLQTYLTPKYFTNAAGATGFYGPITKAAIAAWQTANGIAPAVGYFGPLSQAKYAALVAATPATPATDDSSDDDTSTDDSDDTTSDELSGEASLINMEIDGAADDTIEEGAEDAELAVATVEFADGDAMITRMDVSVNTAIVGTDAWDVLDTLSLVVDGDVVATIDASDSDEYTNEAAGTLRFSGLDIIAMEDEELEITIAATLQGSIDTADQGAFTVEVENLRFIDGTDVTSTESTGNDFGITESFTIENAGNDDELIVKTSTSDPDGKTFQVEDDARSGWENVFTFDLDTDDSVNDVELTTVVVTVAVVGTSTTYSTYAKFVNDAELVIDGTTISAVTIGGTATTAILTFDVDGDVTIDAGDRVAADLMLKFNALAAADEGVTVQGLVTSVQADLIVAEGADDLSAATQISGSATGDVHTLRTAGADVSAGTITSVVTTQDLATNDYATYKMQFEVTAFNQDVYISVVPATSTNYTLEDGSGVAAVAGTRTATLSSTGSQVGTAFEITEGSTETITLEVTYVPGVANTAARLNFNTLTFGSTSGTPTGQTWTASPDEDYRTAVVTVVN